MNYKISGAIAVVVIIIIILVCWHIRAPSIDEMFTEIKKNPDKAKKKYELDDSFMLELDQMTNENGGFTKKDLSKLVKKYDELKKD